jgi:hypothetical protein
VFFHHIHLVMPNPTSYLYQIVADLWAKQSISTFALITKVSKTDKLSEDDKFHKTSTIFDYLGCLSSDLKSCFTNNIPDNALLVCYKAKVRIPIVENIDYEHITFIALSRTPCQ